MRNYESIEKILERFHSGMYRHANGKIFSGDKELKGTKQGKGKYLSFQVMVNGKVCKPRFHNVIYALTHGIDELKRHETIDHIDGDKYNNHPDNLEGCSVEENNRRWYSEYYGKTDITSITPVSDGDNIKKELCGMFGLKSKKKKEVVEERKTRSDKKVQVAPTVSVKLKRELERLAFILDQPVKFVGEVLCYEGIHTKDVIELLSPYFQRGALRSERTVFFGHLDNPSLRESADDEKTDRISIRFDQRDYGDIQLLANLLDVTPTRATAILLDASIRHIDIIQTLLLKYNFRNSLDDEIEKELRKLMRFINKNNPYKMRMWNKALSEMLEKSDEKRDVAVRGRRIQRNVIDKKTYDRLRIKDTETYRWQLDGPIEPASKNKALKKPQPKKEQKEKPGI